MRRSIHFSSFLLLGFLVLTGPAPVHGQESQDPFLRSDTLRQVKGVQMVALPVVFYTPETQFGFGAGLQLFFPYQTNIYNSRKSNIFVDAIYTTQNQLILDAKPQIYFLRGDLYLESPVQFKIYPNAFWGIGNRTPDEDRETYNMRTTTIQTTLYQRLPPHFNFGLRFWFEDHQMREVEEDGLLDTEDIPGADGARLSGLGAAINLDDRDVIEAPTRGNYVQFSGEFSSRAFGATHSFNKYILDFRKYFSLRRHSVLAVQAFLEGNFGNVPFQKKAWLGGGEKMRGYFKGRYMDDHMFVLQAEYRWRFKPRWVLAGFFSAGEVAPVPFDYGDVIKVSFGGGIRFQLKRDLPTLLRLDVGIGQEGNSGFYFGVNEAF